MHTLTIPAHTQAITVEEHPNGNVSLYDRTEDQTQNHSANEMGTHLWTGPAADARLALSDLGFKHLHGMLLFDQNDLLTAGLAYYRGALLDEVTKNLLADAA